MSTQSNKSATITIRLPQDMLELIDQQRESFRISRGNWAKSILINQLTNPEQEVMMSGMEECRDKLFKLEEQVNNLEKLLTRHLYLLLLELSNLTPEETKELVRTRFLQKERGNRDGR